MKVLFSPHNDDESLFAAHICLRNQPLVVVCLRSEFQSSLGVSFVTRESETAEACKILGCEYQQWQFRDVRPPWGLVLDEMKKIKHDLAPTVVFAPAQHFAENDHLPEDEARPLSGVLHHDMVGFLAQQVFDSIVYYQTYTRWGGHTREGVQVDLTPSEVSDKRRALWCYESQIELDSTGHHFAEPLTPEWIA